MTVRNLKAILEQAPPDAQVMIHASAPTQDIRVRSARHADDYILSDKKGLHTHAPDALLNWMLKSGGIVKKESEVEE